MEMHEIPKRFNVLLEKDGIIITRVLQINDHKGRYCVAGRSKDGKELLIKWNVPTMREYYSKLEKEKLIYHLLDGHDLTPHLISCETYLSTELVEGCITARRFLIDNRYDGKKIMCIILRILTQWEKMYLFVNENFDKNKIEKKSLGRQFHSEMFNAWVSRPFDTHNYKVHRFCNHLSFWLFTRIEHRKIEGMLQRHILSPSIIHGDYHLNNILVSDDKTYIIDFEDLCMGYAEIELAYMYAQIWVLLPKPKDAIIARADDAFRELLLRNDLSTELYDDARKLLLSQMAMNRCFFAEEHIDLNMRSRIMLWKESYTALTYRSV